MGFKGYINSDSGIIDNMDWGVENLAKDDKAAKAINAGVDIIADTNEVHWIKRQLKMAQFQKRELMKLILGY